MIGMTPFACAEGRGDRPGRRRSRFTLACARAAPLALGGGVAGAVARLQT